MSYQEHLAIILSFKDFQHLLSVPLAAIKQNEQVCSKDMLKSEVKMQILFSATH